jgi:hypothetical protein
MTYIVGQGRDYRQPVSTVEELDAALDHLTEKARAEGRNYKVGVAKQGEHGKYHFVGFDIGIGHPDRSFFLVYGIPNSPGYAYEPNLAAWPEEIAFDVGGQAAWYEPHDTRVTPQTARRAAREFFTTDRPPTCLQWHDADQLA